jgi:hypothetical protein
MAKKELLPEVDDDGVDDMSGLQVELDASPEAIEAFQKDLHTFLTENLVRLDELFAKHPEILDAVSEYGLTLQMVPFEIEFEPEDDSGLH